MGTRLHYAKKYEIEWDGGNFNHQQSGIYDLLSEYDCNICYDEEDGGEWSANFEVDVEDIERLVTALKNRKEDEVLFSDKWGDTEITYAVKDILPFFEDAFANGAKTGGVIHFSWF